MHKAFAIAAVIALLVPVSALAITFTDDTLDPADWLSYSDNWSSNSMSSCSVALLQDSRFEGYMWTRGDYEPDPFGPGMFLEGRVSISQAWFLVGATYTPSAQGAIQAIDWDYDAMGYMLGGFGFGPWVPVIRQDGLLYPYNENLYSYDGSWHNVALTGLTAEDFGYGHYAPHPDFSKNGGQIEFGGHIWGSQGSTDYVSTEMQVWVDDWEVNVSTVPEPSSLIALGSGLLALAGTIRRRR